MKRLARSARRPDGLLTYSFSSATAVSAVCECQRFPRLHGPQSRGTLSFRRPAKASRKGMSLLEVFVALAIFIAALAVVTQIISTGSRAANRAQFQSEATLRAESCMAEAVAGIIPMQNDKKSFDDDSTWQWALTVEAGPHSDSLLLTVNVEHTNENGKVNGLASLKRIIRDPQLFLNAASATTNSSAMDLLK